MFYLLYSVLAFVLWASPSFAATEIVGDARGTTPASRVTVTCPDANHCALDVAIKEGSITLSGADGAILDGVSSSIKATVKDYVNSNPLAIIPVDTNGDPASLTGGTQYDQGTATTDTDKLMMMGCVRADSAAVATGVIAGDRARCVVDATGRLWVRPTGGVTPASDFVVPTDAITVWSLNGCFNTVTGKYDPCAKADSGAGTVGANTMRTAEATDSQLSADIAAIKAAVQLIDDDQAGATNNHHTSVGTTEDETEIKATAGRVMSIQVSNSAATVAYMRCAQLTAANTTPGTSAVFWGMAIPGATTGAGMTANFGPAGMAFTPALTCWVVTDKAETGVTEVAAGDVQWNIQYK